MNILLVNIDSDKIPNIALKKIEKYYKDRGHNISWSITSEPDFQAMTADKIFVSCIFKENKYKCEEWLQFNNTSIGGSGWDLTTKLPDIIENINPMINIGFTTRGCIRKCRFCIVPEKEGYIHKVSDIYDIWDGISKKVILLDNNILALPDHFKLICEQAIKEKILIDFNQGLDHRLLTDDICKYLSKIRHKNYRFAFDDPAYLPTVKKAISLLHEHNLNFNTWYVLSGYNTTLKEDLERITFLRKQKEKAYLMRYSMDYKYIPLAMWTNNKKLQRVTFKKFLDYPERKKYKKYYQKHYPFVFEY